MPSRSAPGSGSSRCLGCSEPTCTEPPDAVGVQEQHHHHLRAGRTPSLHGDPSGASRCGSPPDPAQRPDPAGRTPGGSTAAGPPGMATATAPARDSRSVRSCSCRLLPGRSIAGTAFSVDLRAAGPGSARGQAQQMPSGHTLCRSGRRWHGAARRAGSRHRLRSLAGAVARPTDWTVVPPGATCPLSPSGE